MSAGFGRKGLSADQMGMAPGGFGRQGFSGESRAAQDFPSDGDELARRREEFLASERARRAALRDEGQILDGGGLTEVAMTARARPTSSKPVKNIVFTYLLWWFFGSISAHRFYLGATGSALGQFGLLLGSLAMLLLLPAMGVLMLIGWALWYLADAVLIIGLAKRANQPDSALVFA